MRVPAVAAPPPPETSVALETVRAIDPGRHSWNSEVDSTFNLIETISADAPRLSGCDTQLLVRRKP